ncbi:tetratricopeptide repeat protein [Dechloromonas sp. A34]|uniref:tetratricopeptide repeat protein n=1 Tax=Dechloromonas sp. A34 TaxID=447588 RepID=UPI0022497120|nr:tetratricopeptide repeat protein [Dechloromonas sp. A34]
MTLKNKLYRPKPILLVLIASFLGACSRDDFPEKIVEPTITAAAPSTMGYMPAEAVGQKKVGADDLTTIATNDPIVKKILVALQANDDKTLRDIEGSSEGMDSVFCPPRICEGANFEPAEEVQNIIDTIDGIARDNPSVFVKLAEYSQRKDASESLVPVFWYEEAIRLGSQVAEEKLAALAAAEKNGNNYLQLAEVFGGEFPDSPSMNAKKAADYLGKALSKGIDANGRQRAQTLAAKLVKRNGPDVAAPLWPLVLEQYPNPHPATAEAKAEALKTCVELGGHPHDPASGKDATLDKSTGKKEATACRIVIEADEKNALATANLGFALSKIQDKGGSLIAYARAAELGNSHAIAEYWYGRYAEDPQKMRAALDVEAAAGNPWANLALSYITSGDLNPRDKDSKVREEQLLIAASKNIPAAQNYLGRINNERKNFEEAMKWFKMAAHNGYARAMYNIGLEYENGGAVSKDAEASMKWYSRALTHGDTRAEEKLAKLAAAEKAKGESSLATRTPDVQAASVIGAWMCKTSSPDGSAQTFFLFDGRQFAYSIGNSARMVSLSYKAVGAQASGTFTEFTRNGGTSEVSIPYQIFFRSAAPDRLVFDLTIKGTKGDQLSNNECAPMPGETNQKSTSSHESSRDRILIYANDLASQLERSGHPACQMIANNIRSFGNSGQPDVVRERQIDAMYDKAPSICR